MNVRTPNSRRKKRALKPVIPHRSTSKIKRRRSPSRKSKIGPILLLFTAIALIILLSYQVTSKLFPLRKIDIAGCQRLSQQAVLDVLDIEAGNSGIFKVSVANVEKKLEEKLSMVKDAQVSKKVIRGILKVNLVEREPIAILRHPTEDGYCYFLIDPQGILLEKHDSVENLENMVLIVGVGELSSVELGKPLDVESVHLALSVIEQSKVNGLNFGISAINANNPNKIFLLLDNKLVPIISSDFIEKGLRNVSWVLRDKTHELPSNKDSIYFDARFKDVVYRRRR